MQLYIKVKLSMDGSDAVTTQLAAVNVKDPNCLSDKTAAEILDKVTQSIVFHCGSGARAISSEFVPSSEFDIHYSKNEKDCVWRTLYFKAVILSTRNNSIHFDTKALYRINVGKSPLLVSKDEKAKIKQTLAADFCSKFGISPYDIQEISPSGFDDEMKQQINQ